jgi:hypothetical protein
MGGHRLGECELLKNHSDVRPVGPSYVCWFINTMNTTLIGIINQSYRSYKPT